MRHVYGDIYGFDWNGAWLPHWWCSGAYGFTDQFQKYSGIPYDVPVGEMERRPQIFFVGRKVTR